MIRIRLGNIVLLVALLSGCVSLPVENAALLRYGDRTPAPLNEVERVLQQGRFVGDVTSISSMGQRCRGEIVLGSLAVPVFIKHDYYLYVLQHRAGIPFHSDNRNADAAFHVNRVVQLVNTPEHVIRDDVPHCGNKDGVSAAGVQRFATGSSSVSADVIEALTASEAMLDELEAVAVFDSLIGNTDRHDRNWRVMPRESNGQRLVALDHSLAFPVEDFVTGNYLMIDRYLASPRGGSLSQETLLKLQRLRDQRSELNPVLLLNLNPRAVEKFWGRLDRLIEEGAVFSLQPPSARGSPPQG